MELVSRKDALAQGLTRYFTGKPCHRGHVSERNTCDHACVECHRLKDMASREKRRPYMREHMREWREKNLKHCQAEARKFYAIHREKRVAAKRKSREEAPEKHRASLRKTYHANKEKYAISSREWRQANPETVRAHRWKRKARRMNADGVHTAQEILALFAAQSGTCNVCNKSIVDGYHVDHVMPLSRGGSNWPDNLQLLCEFCNLSKGSKTMSEWLAQRA